MNGAHSSGGLLPRAQPRDGVSAATHRPSFPTVNVQVGGNDRATHSARSRGVSIHRSQIWPFSASVNCATLLLGSTPKSNVATGAPTSSGVSTGAAALAETGDVARGGAKC